MKGLTGELRWPEPDGLEEGQQRSRKADLAADIYGNALVPYDFVTTDESAVTEREMGELLARIFERQVEGLTHEQRRTWDLAIEGGENGLPEVNRRTIYPVFRSLRKLNYALAWEGIVTERGPKPGDLIHPNQVSEWFWMSFEPKMVGYFFDDHPEVLERFVSERPELAALSREELRRRFSKGLHEFTDNRSK